MTPEMQRALRLNPRLRKRHRYQQAALLVAVQSGEPDAELVAARDWAQVEQAAAADVEEKTANPPQHRISFLVEESVYADFCQTAADNDLSPSEVARRYCLSGHRFTSLIWETIKRGGTVGDWVRVSKEGPNLAQLALPNFSRMAPVGLL